MSVALLLDLYYTGGWQKLLSSLLIYLSVACGDSSPNRGALGKTVSFLLNS